MNAQLLVGMAGRVYKHCKGNGKRYAIVEDGRTINVVHWDPAEAPDWKPLRGIAVPMVDTTHLRVTQPVQEAFPGPAVLPALPTMMAVLEPLAQSQPMPLPPPPEQAFTISDLLARADAPEPKIVPTLLEIGGALPSLSNPDSEPMKRERAKSRVMGAVRRVGQSVIGDQVRYELALKAMNDNVVAIQLLEEEASIRKLSVRELAVQIVEDRRVRERRMMQVYAILARASANIDNATGRTIDTLADKAVQEIAALED